MAAKTIGISRDLIIHPGETLGDVLTDRDITQAELAVMTGVSPAYVCNVISGKKDISAKFALALEYALGVSRSFWINLQANYDAELLAYNEIHSITAEERTARDLLRDVVKHLRSERKMPLRQSKDDSILTLRRILHVSNLANLKEVVSNGSFRLANQPINPIVLGACVRLCQMASEDHKLQASFDTANVSAMLSDIKCVMHDSSDDVIANLQHVMETIWH